MLFRSKLIPAGTGMKRYRNTRLSTDNDLMGTLDFDEEDLEEEALYDEALDDVEIAYDDVDDADYEDDIDVEDETLEDAETPELVTE